MRSSSAVAFAEIAKKANSIGRARITKKKQKAKVIQLRPKAKKTGLLSPEEQESTILEFRLKARSLAHSILRRWRARLDAQEVDSVVDLSLCEAVRRFNKNKGASFITFLFYHLRGNLIRAVTTAATLNFVPLPDFDSVEAAYEESSTSRTRVISALEVAEAVCNYDYESPDQTLFKKELSEISTEACSKLDPLEREVIYRIYVLEEQLMDIANSLGYSRCHISRVKRRALEALHQDLGKTIYPEGGAGKPKFDDEDTGARRRPALRRRLVQRRKLRIVKDQQPVVAEAVGA